MNTTYKTIQLHPHRLQFFVNEVPVILLTLIIIFLAGYDEFPIPEFIPLLLAGASVLGLYLIYRYYYLVKMVYTITGEQLQSEHGIFSTQKDFIELYRIIDYREAQSFLQVLFGIKTVTIYSGDRSNPEFRLIGIKNKYEVIEFLRERVEYNKHRRNIYEFTNNQ